MCDRICQERWKECMVRGPQSLECLGGNVPIDNDDGSGADIYLDALGVVGSASYLESFLRGC